MPFKDDKKKDKPKKLSRNAEKDGSGSEVELPARPRGELGMFQCSEPANKNRAVDIVLVHGLTGDRETTWTHRSTSCFWPEQLLPRDFPNARIFTYGYDADVGHMWSTVSQSRIGDHAQTFLTSLAHERDSEGEADRPLFFIAHSLGGLVVEDMLLYSKNSAEPHLKSIVEATRGIIFMATPHCGSQLADWAKIGKSVMVLIRANDAIVSVLEPQSEVLARIQKEFHTMIRDRDAAGLPKWQITCFFEDLNTSAIGSLVVPKNSATLNAYTSVAMQADHSGVAKFRDERDPGYKFIRGELRRWCRDLGPRLVAQAAQTREAESLGSGGNKSMRGGFEPASNFMIGSQSNIGQVFQGNNWSGNFDNGEWSSQRRFDRV
ncbi:Alpha/Beta hydrolase protein [Elsinoe ampelina]|uniref:Alpha/Beta hydrolase protein n=1 Tax=Elsinoe ampelina TaxID=302913 RepID=A0A6A6GQZ6_9PEZI|nr:Alpha/Beta hydrolase protein [Elsinoe ampelina]